MDNLGYFPFPFSAALIMDNGRDKSFFLALPEEEQQKILNECGSYEEFQSRLEDCRKKQ
ncbi:MAG: hypothetical protein GX424_02950 [Clostridiales bacterium]|jgi:hypothetical protein|nr:hypothetical protein [Clostridiales bacterium]